MQLLLLVGYLAIAALFAAAGFAEWRASRQARLPLLALAAVFWPVALVAVIIAAWLSRRPLVRPHDDPAPASLQHAADR